MGAALLGIWTWLAFALISGLGYLICLPLFLITAPFDPRRRIIGGAIRLVGRLMCAATPAWGFHVELLESAPRPGRTVCVSNHCSNIDPFLLAHLPWEMKYLAKSALFRVPFVGWGMTLAGDIRLVRGSARSVRMAMAQAGRYLRQGMPVLIFPEGTRSSTGHLLPFKDGAFRLAIEHQADILPIGIVGTAEALRRGDWRPRPSRGACLPGEPIATVGLSVGDIPELKREVVARIEALRKELVCRGYEGSVSPGSGNRATSPVERGA